MTIQKLPGTAITPGTITVVQLESTVATTVSTGGGPKITNLAITSNVNVTLDDTAVDLTGGFIRLTGTGFNTGCLVYAGLLPAASTTFISNTEVRAQLAAQSAGTYPVYLVNTDGGTAIRVPGVTYSAIPAWQTASSLGDQYDGVLLNLSVIATDAVTYTLVSGSLPPGLSLNSNTGVISGTITGVVADTVYTFTINAVDAQLQDSPRVFTINVTVSDPYFRLTTLLLTGNSGNTVVTDSSTNNFPITVVGDSRASNFSPYLTGWSNYFNGSSRLTSASTGFGPGTGNFTVEAWIYPTSLNTNMGIFIVTTTGGLWLGKNGSNWVLRAYAVADYLTTATMPTTNTWTHVAWVRNGTTATIYFNGNSVVSGTVTYNFVPSNVCIGDDGGAGAYITGYISNLRYTNTAVYTANFTPATSSLSSITGTQLLTCQSNRFLDNSVSANTFSLGGSPQIASFNPFNLTNTGTAGSMYFDGTGDYVLTSSTTAMNLGANPFCLEMWFYLNSTGSTYYGLCGSQTDFKGPSISRYGSVLMYGLSSNGSSWNVMGAEGTTGSTTINPYQWYHLVLCRTGNTISAYVNGLRDATVASSATLISRTEGFCIGNWYAGLYPWNGYISNVRFVVGSNPYDATQTTLTIPAAPVTATANTQLLTLQNRQPHNNSSFQDSSSNNFLITRSGNATQGTFSPFSPHEWTVYFDGNSYLRTPSSGNLGIGTQDFTIECWYYAINNASFAGSFVQQLSGDYGIIMSPQGFFYKRDNSYEFSCNAASLPPLNAWHHYAVSRSGTNVSLWIDGVRQNSVTILSSLNMFSTTIIIGDYALNSYRSYYNGYVKDFRFVIGSTVYNVASTTITVPTTKLPVVSGTQLLACQDNFFKDRSTNNFSLLNGTGSPRIQAFSPYAPTAVYSPVTYGGSAYFDGTGDTLVVPSTSSLAFGTGDFCVELWVYWTASGVVNAFFANTTTSGAGDTQFCLEVVSTNKVRVTGWFGVFLTGATNLTSNSWNHIAVCRSGTTLSLFLNGNRDATTTSANNWSSTNAFCIGDYPVGGGAYTGYMSNLRVVKGSPVYDPTSSTITVPTALLTNITNTSLLLNFTNAGIYDATGRNNLETVGDAKISTAQSRWGGSSIAFDGTGDRVTLVPSEFNVLSGDFTIECWFYQTTRKSLSTVIAQIPSTTSTAWRLSPNNGSANDAIMFVVNVSGSWNIVIDVAVTWGLNVWNHIAITRSGSTVRGFANGTLSQSATFSSLVGSTSLQFALGYNGVDGVDYQGYLQDVRITKGYARYTANFTPPTGSPRLK